MGVWRRQFLRFSWCCKFFSPLWLHEKKDQNTIWNYLSGVIGTHLEKLLRRVQALTHRTFVISHRYVRAVRLVTLM